MYKEVKNPRNNRFPEVTELQDISKINQHFLLLFANLLRFATPFVKDLLEILLTVYLVKFFTPSIWIQKEIDLDLNPDPHYNTCGSETLNQMRKY